MPLGDLCGACFEVAGACRCVSFELGGSVDEGTAVPAVPPGSLALALAATALLITEINEDPDQRAYLWDLEDEPCR